MGKLQTSIIAALSIALVGGGGYVALQDDTGKDIHSFDSAHCMDFGDGIACLQSNDATEDASLIAMISGQNITKAPPGRTTKADQELCYPPPKNRCEAITIDEAIDAQAVSIG